jgi:hypothetical protein
MVRDVLRALTVLLLAWSVMGCANPEARHAAEQAALDQQDDAQCRTNGVVAGSAAYHDCRSRFVEMRAEKAALQEKRREAFQQTTGAGTEALSGH